MRVRVYFNRARALALALALGLGIVAGTVSFGAGTAMAAPTCPTVDPSTGVVSPPPSLDADWSGCDLKGADLYGYLLVGMNLSGADLSNATLITAKISGGDMTGANLTSANLTAAKVSANLTDANFTSANMSGIDLTAANITGAIMATANISQIKTFNTTGVPASLPAGWEDIDSTILGPSADAWEAILSGADLAGLDLDQANLYGAALTGANLSGTDLAQAILSGVQSGGITAKTPPSLPSGWLLANGYLVGNGANLYGASLTGTDLAGLDLSNTDLASAELNGANLTGTDLDSANLSHTDFTNADLTSASAVSANMTGSILGGATTTGMNLTDANLEGADLSGADLAGATLTGIESGSLTGTAVLPSGWTIYNGYLVGPKANLSSADLAGLSLTNVDLSGVNLSQADLEHASLLSVSLAGATLASTDLTSANLSNADLSNASLTNANLTSTNLDGATVTGTDFTGVTWSGTTCPDGSDSNAHDNGCFSPLDTAPPVASPHLLGGGSNVNGWFNAPVTVSWDWTDDGQINPAECTRFTTTTTNGSITLTASCTDVAGYTGTASVSLKVDTTRPAVKVTGVRNGQHFVIGKVPAAGCSTSELISGVASAATVSVATGGSAGVGPFTATCTGAVSVAGLPQAAPVQAMYTVGYGFGGFTRPLAGSTISRSAGHFTAAFRLVTASGKAIPSSAASNLAFAGNIRVVLRGPGIRPVTTYCAWSGRSRQFTCSIKIPAKVRRGRSNNYTITAQENVGTVFYDVPKVGTARDPEIIHFR